jgi:DNA-directed RNA polymerase specialized sigma24 family protein
VPPAPGERWSLTRRALDRLLRRFDEQPEAAAREYEFLRQRLITYFLLRGLDSPEQLADEAMDRVARRLDEGEAIEHVRAYFHGVALRIASESAKRQARERAAADGYRPFLVSEQAADALEARARCLDECLWRLPPESRALIQRYYQTGPQGQAEARRRLAEELLLSPTALKVRAFRIRAQLEECLAKCLAGRRPPRG